MQKKDLLTRLDEGVVIGDGGFVFALEKRGYVKAGPWTPEATVEHPEAGQWNEALPNRLSPAHKSVLCVSFEYLAVTLKTEFQ